jgi:hypothetical protein
MKNSWCPKCNKVTRWQRQYSVFTMLLLIASGGFWLLALPFYKSYCTSCGIKWSDAAVKSFPMWDYIELP